VVVAEAQDSGRGRLDRSWSSPPRAGLTFSVLLRPTTGRATWSWLPLLSGLAMQQALVGATEPDVSVKWPNDLLVGERKLAGLLAEVVGDAVVLGVGLNVSTRLDELPAGGTSLALEGSELVDRDTVLRALLRALGSAYDGWVLRGGDSTSLRDEYAAACSTVGSRVRVRLTGGGQVEGTAVGVDESGSLVVRADSAEMCVLSSGDVEHVRPA
jgi:BirA family biotin operon repressor/biotin-[acetyl-CoA-carboxylase] ligase